ncbi:MAG: efflux RND transporter permease subunit [Planctomycetes bacterium]|nr:efflux RND transporter permease subunit [Planctomycetota bacterium]
MSIVTSGHRPAPDVPSSTRSLDRVSSYEEFIINHPERALVPSLRRRQRALDCDHWARPDLLVDWKVPGGNPEALRAAVIPDWSSLDSALKRLQAKLKSRLGMSLQTPRRSPSNRGQLVIVQGEASLCLFSRVARQLGTRLSTLPTVDRIQISGGVADEPMVVVTLDATMLRRHGLKCFETAAAVDRLGKAPRDPSELGDLIVASRGNASLRLAHVAMIDKAERLLDGVLLANGLPAVVLRVDSTGQNALDEGVYAVVPEADVMVWAQDSRRLTSLEYRLDGAYAQGRNIAGWLRTVVSSKPDSGENAGGLVAFDPEDPTFLGLTIPSSVDLSDFCRRFHDRHPDADLLTVAEGDPGRKGSTLGVGIEGSDWPRLRSTLHALQSQLEGRPGLILAGGDELRARPRLEMAIDPEQTARSGRSQQEITTEIQTRTAEGLLTCGGAVRVQMDHENANARGILASPFDLSPMGVEVRTEMAPLAQRILNGRRAVILRIIVGDELRVEEAIAGIREFANEHDRDGVKVTLLGDR